MSGRLYDSDGDDARIALEQATPRQPLHLSAAAASLVLDDTIRKIELAPLKPKGDRACDVSQR